MALMRNRQKDNVAWSSRAMDEAIEIGGRGRESGILTR